MKIGIIGAGNIGALLADKWTKMGNEVAIANSRGPETLTDVAAATGARAVAVEDVTKGADLVVVTIPQKSVPLLPKGLFDGLAADAVVIDTGNYYPSFRDGAIEEIDAGMPESVWVAKLIGRPVIKAFNNVSSYSLADKGLPAGAPGRIAVPVFGDEARAKGIVLDLVEALGFDAIDGGPLAESWRQQPGTPVYATDLDASGVREGLAKADKARTPEMRELSVKKLFELPPEEMATSFVSVMRSIW